MEDQQRHGRSIKTAKINKEMEDQLRNGRSIKKWKINKD